MLPIAPPLGDGESRGGNVLERDGRLCQPGHRCAVACGRRDGGSVQGRLDVCGSVVLGGSANLSILLYS